MTKQHTSSRRALIVTGEASGDLHGAKLIQAAGQIDPELKFFGVGGKRMAEAGCEILIPADQLAVMGVVEVIARFAVIRQAFRTLVKVLQAERRPDLVILIDYPGFNLRLAKAAKAAGVPVLYFISPKVWAWRRGRIHTIAQRVDKLAVIFPFEPEIYQGLGLDVEYVGNPLLDEQGSAGDRSSYLQRHGLDPARPVVGLFPGSRNNELKYIFSTLIASAQLLHQARPDLQFLLPVAPSLSVEDLRQRLAGARLPAVLVEDNIYDTAAACDAVISVSGTVTLQIALAGTPMVIIYKAAPLTYAIGKRLVKVEHFGLPNIVAGQGIVPELLQEAANPEAISTEILRLLQDADYNRKQRNGLELMRQRMGAPGCSARVARIASAMSRGQMPRKDQE
ncbi:MAG: lipid-A-disaccharide synthase [Trichloromonadaceae bacterium]